MPWTREQVNTLLQANDRAVERAMVALLGRQTDDEVRSEDTKHLNGIGFSGAHARHGTYYAKWVQSGRRLTGHHLERARKIALIHSKQLVDEANRTEQPVVIRS